MRPALISRTKRRGTTALATALRLFFLKASDMWHLCCALTRIRSALDRDCAANTCHDIEWDDRRWNDCAPPSLSYGAAHPLPRIDVRVQQRHQGTEGEVVLAAHHRRNQRRAGRPHVHFQIDAMLLEDTHLFAEIERRHVGHRNEAGMNRHDRLRRVDRRCAAEARDAGHDKTERNGPVSRSDAHLDPLHFLLTAATVRLHRDCDPTAIAASLARAEQSQAPNEFTRGMPEQTQSRTNSKTIFSILAIPASLTNISAGYDRLI